MTNEELAELERLLEASNSKSLHPEDVASARFRLGKIARDGRLQSLIATAMEAEALRAENARLQARADAARREALEEAARMAEGRVTGLEPLADLEARMIAKLIRALKENPNAG